MSGQRRWPWNEPPKRPEKIFDHELSKDELDQLRQYRADQTQMRRAKVVYRAGVLVISFGACIGLVCALITWHLNHKATEFKAHMYIPSVSAMATLDDEENEADMDVYELGEQSEVPLLDEASYEWPDEIDPKADIESTVLPVLASVPLDAKTQWAIYDEVCYGNDELFCALMAVARQETNFDASAIGDSGRSFGLCQINTSAMGSQLTALGISKSALLEPVTCASVAASVLADIADRIGSDAYATNELYMQYNMGQNGAAKAIRSGVCSTEYSRSALAFYEGYLEEIN